MYIHIYLYMYLYIYPYIYTLLYTCTHKALQFWSTFSNGYCRRDLSYVHTRTHTHFYRHTTISSRPFFSGALSPRANSIHRCMYVYIHTHIHTYIHIYIQLYIRIHTNTHPCRSCTLSPRQTIGEIIRTYTRMYTHTYVHTHIRRHPYGSGANCAITNCMPYLSYVSQIYTLSYANLMPYLSYIHIHILPQ